MQTETFKMCWKSRTHEKRLTQKNVEKRQQKARQRKSMEKVSLSMYCLVWSGLFIHIMGSIFSICVAIQCQPFSERKNYVFFIWFHWIWRLFVLSIVTNVTHIRSFMKIHSKTIIRQSDFAIKNELLWRKEKQKSTRTNKMCFNHSVVYRIFI